jgi:hypothetical protein
MSIHLLQRRVALCPIDSIGDALHKIGTGFGTERHGTTRDRGEHSCREIDVDWRKFGHGGMMRDCTIRLLAH